MTSRSPGGKPQSPKRSPPALNALPTHPRRARAPLRGRQRSWRRLTDHQCHAHSGGAPQADARTHMTGLPGHFRLPAEGSFSGRRRFRDALRSASPRSIRSSKIPFPVEPASSSAYSSPSVRPSGSPAMNTARGGSVLTSSADSSSVSGSSDGSGASSVLRSSPRPMTSGSSHSSWGSTQGSCLSNRTVRGTRSWCAGVLLGARPRRRSLAPPTRTVRLCLPSRGRGRVS